MSDTELVELLRAASAELSARVSGRALVRASVEKRLEARTTASKDEPSPEDKDFILSIKGYLQSGAYIKAGERARAGEILQRFPRWARLQQMPVDGSGSAWRRAAENYRARRAQER